MKKTYIIPKILTVVLNTKSCILLGGSDGLGEGGEAGIGTKEYVGDDGASAGGKNVWDEEW